MNNIPVWATEYPTISMVNGASVNTLISWYENLPDPQTDVERTIRRRIRAKTTEKVREEIRKTNPETAEKWNHLIDLVANVGIKMDKM